MSDAHSYESWSVLSAMSADDRTVYMRVRLAANGCCDRSPEAMWNRTCLELQRQRDEAKAEAREHMRALEECEAKLKTAMDRIAELELTREGPNE